ncbi:hexokinase-1 [Nilaparvata lugens]
MVSRQSSVDVTPNKYYARISTPLLRNTTKMKKVENLLAGIHLSEEVVSRVKSVFLSEIELGINEEPSSLQMENTYVPELPDGTEEGLFLALDVGGTNFRILLLELMEGRLVREEVKHYHITDELRLGPGTDLFDFLATCIADFVKEFNIADQTLPMGFTFSFPMHQRSMDCGCLVTWTKSFKCAGVQGEDVVEMLREAIRRRGDIKVEVVAVLNDTTGTLMQGALLDHRTTVGLILGTGSNACYLERADRVHHWESKRHGEKEIVIDVEWGAFGDNGVLDFIKTDFDRQVDDNSLIKKSFMFEKYIGGKYLGEIVRVILVKLIEEELLFDGDVPPKLTHINSFRTSYVSLIDQDCVDEGTMHTETILSEDFDVELTTPDDLAVVKYVCEIVSLRAALLVSTGLAAILQHMDRPDSTIAVDGSLYKYHPRFQKWMDHFIRLLAPQYAFRLMLAEDGSGKGAGLTAAIAMKLRAREEAA